MPGEALRGFVDKTEARLAPGSCRVQWNQLLISKDDRAEMKVSLPVNEPLFHHAGKLIKEPIKGDIKGAKNVNKGVGHFVRRMENIADYSVSK